VTLSPLDDRRLDELRTIGDPEADALAAALHAGHEHLDERDLVRAVLDQIGNAGRGQGRLEGLRDWLCGGPPLPDWVDRARVQAGQEFFCEWALPICTALFCASLPTSYAAANGVQVLALTSDLATGDMRRRIAETAQMLIDVMDLGTHSPDALEPSGQGHVTARGVRLLHAVVRQAIISSPAVAHTCDETVSPRWCPAWGHPVNQEDLLGTLLTFSVVVLHALDQLGIPYDADAAESYVHVWCVVGTVLGIEPGLLPLTRSEAEDLAATIFRRQHAPSVAGQRLMTVLLTEMELSMPWGLRNVPRTLVRHLTLPGVADDLAVPKASWWRPALGALRVTGPVARRVPAARRMFEVPGTLLGRSMMRMFVDRSLSGDHAPFRLDMAGAGALAVDPSVAGRRRRERRRHTRAKRHAPHVDRAAPGAALLTGRRPAPVRREDEVTP
jgi:hypothetical protein